VLAALDRIHTLLQAQDVVLAGLRQQRRDEGEWPSALMKRMAALEREVRGERQDIGRAPRMMHRRLLGAD
jgi:hypothetical protein